MHKGHTGALWLLDSRYLVTQAPSLRTPADQFPIVGLWVSLERQCSVPELGHQASLPRLLAGRAVGSRFQTLKQGLLDSDSVQLGLSRPPLSQGPEPGLPALLEP